MKLDLSFEQNQQNINVPFLESGGQFSADFGETSVLHDGQNGATFIPSVSADGIISWTNDRELPNPPPVNIKGDKGDKGDQGERGDIGADGISPTVSLSKSGKVTTLEITDKNGTQRAEILDGADGEGGGVTSWNDLTDKPFYDELTEGLITFDGDYSKYECVAAGEGAYLVRVSDKVLTYDEVLGATVRVVQCSTGIFEDSVVRSENGYSCPTSLDGLGSMLGVDVYGVQVTLNTRIENGGVGIMSIGGDMNALHAAGFPCEVEGTYFAFSFNSVTDFYVESLSCLTGLVEAIKPLDEKYLPDSVVLESELEGKGYQTEEQVTALINNALGVIENGTY